MNIKIGDKVEVKHLIYKNKIGTVTRIIDKDLIEVLHVNETFEKVHPRYGRGTRRWEISGHAYLTKNIEVIYPGEVFLNCLKK